MKSECVVVSNGGSLFLVGPTGQTYRMTIWERIQLAFTQRYPQRGLDAVYVEKQPPVSTGRSLLNMHVDDLFCQANPFPARGDVFMHAYMPGATHYREMLELAERGTPDHWIADAHWQATNVDTTLAPTRFVFIAKSTDPMFDDKTGLGLNYLFRSMETLAIQFAGMCNACSSTQVSLSELIVQGTGE